jgi:competence protein ComEA
LYDFWLKYKYVVLVTAVIVGVLIYHNSGTKQDEVSEGTLPVAHEEVKGESTSKQKEEEKEEKEVLLVDVKGAVVKSGVYELRQGTRVKDAVEAAGGFTEGADSKGVNLAALLQDEMVVYVPMIGEEQSNVPAQGSTPANTQSGVDDKISINTATSEELQKIPGIGATRAESIIKYREEKGAFKKIEDLLEISGIGEKTLEKMKDKIKL